MNAFRLGLRLSFLWSVASVLVVIVTIALGSFIPSERYGATVNALSPSPKFIYLIDLKRALTMQVYPPLESSTVKNIQMHWPSTGEAYLWQQTAGVDAAKPTNVLYLMNLLTGDLETLINSSQNGVDAYFPQDSPVTSPDGRYFAYGIYSTGKIFILDRQTKAIRLALDLSEQRRSEAELGFSSPQWSPDSQYLAFSSGDTLYLINPNENAPPPLKIQRPNQSLVQAQWTTNSDTMWVSSWVGQASPPIRFNLTTHQIEEMDEIDASATQVFAYCDDRWLTYVVPREVNSQTGFPVGNPPRFAGYIRNMETGEVLTLETMLPPETPDVMWMDVIDCEDTPTALIMGRLEGDLSSSQPSLNAIYLMDLKSHAITLVSPMGQMHAWDTDSQTLVYSIVEESGEETLYKYQLQADSQPVKLGAYPTGSTIVDFSNDYSTLLVAEDRQFFGRRLIRVDLHTGAQVYITQSREEISTPQLIPWD